MTVFRKPDISSSKNLSPILKNLPSERERVVLWVPVFLGIGIIYYFSTKNEPNIIFVTLLLTAFSITAIIFRKNYLILCIFILLALIILGVSAAYLQAHTKNAVFLSEEFDDKPIWLRGKIESIDQQTFGYRLLISKPDIWRPETNSLPPEKTPTKIRLSVRTDMENVIPGDYISVKAILSPPPYQPAYHNGYNFFLRAYFEKIGAIGYSISDVKKFSKQDNEKTLKENLENVRINITEKILAALKKEEDKKNIRGNIAAALITGQNGVDKNTLKDMYNSGLGHLLSISGLHMSLVMVGCFFILRLSLAAIPQIALHYNIKKLAALFAISSGLFYLLLAGSPVPAIRSYVMAFTFFLAILLDRTGTPMRPIAIAALLILLFDPYSLTTPSFQMSFAAVTALVAAYEKVPFLQSESFKKFSVRQKVSSYVLGIIISSIVAGLATAPFAIYHFGRYSNYSLLANMIALPVTSFWVMPLGMLSLPLMIFGLEKIVLIPMGWGIDIITLTAYYINNLPHSVISVPQISGWVIGTATIGGLWLCLWETRLRLIGAILLLPLVFFLIFPSPGPDIIISESSKLFAVKNNEGKLAFSSLIHERYSREQWLVANGQEKALRIIDGIKKGNLDISCNKSSCRFISHKKSVILYGDMKSLSISDDSHQQCEEADLIINLTDDTKCAGKIKTIYPFDLNSKGTHAVWLENMDIITAGRPWESRVWTINHLDTNSLFRK